MFSTTGFRVNVQDRENKEAALSSRKEVAKSTRKPLGDRSMNRIQTPFKLVTQNEPKSVQKPAQDENKYPEWLTDVCSFKNVEDNYEDIRSKTDRLDTKAILNLMLNPKTPPFCDTNKFVPPSFQAPIRKYYNFDDDGEYIEELPIMDIELPNFSL